MPRFEPLVAEGEFEPAGRPLLGAPTLPVLVLPPIGLPLGADEDDGRPGLPVWELELPPDGLPEGTDDDLPGLPACDELLCPELDGALAGAEGLLGAGALLFLSLSAHARLVVIIRKKKKRRVKKQRCDLERADCIQPPASC